MKFILTLLFCSLSLGIASQNVKGLVVGKSGDPVPAASIYIPEVRQGIVANSDGAFQLRLDPGVYRMEVRSMGYEPENLEFRVDLDKESELIIRMTPKAISLPELQVSRGEDPAYRIMRKAIEKAPYYHSIIQSATYLSYNKGSGKILGIPALMKALADKEDKEQLELYKDKLFLQESLSEIRFTAPDDYVQTVKAYSSSFPFQDNPETAMRIGLISLYRPLWGNIISPLNPQAFDYYRFRYEGFEEKDGQYINIVRIIPKLKDPRMIEGIIHIADDEWNIRYIDYLGNAMGVESHYTMNFNQVEDDVYLVTDYRLQMKVNVIGFRFHVDMLSSIQYLDIQKNDLITPVAEKKKKEEKKSLEIKAVERKTDVDSLASQRDSVYWSEIRAIPLNEEELYSYQQKDSLKQKHDSLTNVVHNPKFSFMDILTGGRLGNDSSAMSFRYNGLLGGSLKEYNFVDGWWLGQSLEFDFKKRKNKGWVVQSDMYWATARKRLQWKTDFILAYAPARLGELHFSVGRMSEDFSGSAGMDRFLNTIYSLDGGRNYAKFFDSEFIRLNQGVDIANGFRSYLGLELNRSHDLANHTTWNLFGTKDRWTENVPDYAFDLNSGYSRRVNYSVGLEYTPEYYYRMHEGKKQYVRSRFPTFGLVYKQGVPEGFVSDNSAYKQVEFSIAQTIKLGYFNRLNYSLIAGKFFNRNAFNYIDYKHFDISGPWISFRSWNNSYALLPYYTFSTNREWLQAFVNYNTDYLFLKRLPFLQGKMMTETLQAKFLYTPEKPYYSEWAYSVDLPMGLGGVGVFVGLDSFKYNGWGIQFSLPIVQKKKNNQKVSVSVSL